MSQALTGVKRNYPRVEKVAFTMVTTTRKLRPYFQSHTINVLTNLNLRFTLQQLNTSGRLVKWSVELGEFNIEYNLKWVIKG